MGPTGRLETALGAQRRRALEAVSADLPKRVRALPHQFLGRMSTGCPATHSIHERCDFACTACYLSKAANTTPPLEPEAVEAQLDRIRRAAGPAGNVQITSGEVTLLPVERLCAIVRYALDIGLDPMVVTHGQNLLEDPRYLERLVTEAGLRKLSVHIDSTQRGRGARRARPDGPDELELMAERNRFAELVRETQRRTGVHLYAAHAVTVTDDNAQHVPAITRWVLENTDVFRILSFQPVAEVGRTRVDGFSSGAAVWQGVCEGAGQTLNPHSFLMGHPQCTRLCLAYVFRWGDEVRVVEAKRTDHPVDGAFFDALVSGSLAGYDPRAGGLAELLLRLSRSPGWAIRYPRYLLYRLLDGNLGWLPRFGAAMLRGAPWSVGRVLITCHAFMGPSELMTELGRERLQACLLKVPLDGEMVSMCEFNATGLRRRTNLNQRISRDARDAIASAGVDLVAANPLP